MRGFGDFQCSQMRRREPQITDHFNKVRQAIDALEHVLTSLREPMACELNRRNADTKRSAIGTEHLSPKPKLAYSVKDVLELVGIGRTALYAAISAKELRAVKHHRKTLILAKDLDTWLEGLPEMRVPSRE